MKINWKTIAPLAGRPAICLIPNPANLDDNHPETK